MDANKSPENSEVIIKKRSFFLSILCMIVFVYSVFFILIYTAGLIYHNWFAGVLNDFSQVREFTADSVILYSVSGVFLYGLSFSSAILMWRMKRIGFFLYVFSSLFIVLIPLVFGIRNVIDVIIFSTLVILFSLFFLRRNKK